MRTIAFIGCMFHLLQLVAILNFKKDDLKYTNNICMYINFIEAFLQ